MAWSWVVCFLTHTCLLFCNWRLLEEELLSAHYISHHQFCGDIARGLPQKVMRPQSLAHLVKQTRVCMVAMQLFKLGPLASITMKVDQTLLCFLIVSFLHVTNTHTHTHTAILCETSSILG